MLQKMKHLIRDQPLLRAGVLRAGTLVRSLEHAGAGTYTLCYHRVAAGAAGNFAAQIALLKRFGTFIDADTAVDRLRAGRGAEGRAFVLTFDDGYADNVDVALPILQEHRIPAMLFLVSDWIEAPPSRGDRATGYVTARDVETWLAAGLDIGSHSCSHRRFSRLDRDEARRELEGSARALARLSARPVRHFACPWGVADADFIPDRDPVLAAEAGYATFFTTRRGQARHAGDLFSMPRHVVEPEWGTYQFETLLGGPKFARR